MEEKTRKILTALIVVLMLFSSRSVQIMQVRADDVGTHIQV